MSNATDAEMDCGGFFDHIDDFLDVDTFPGIWTETDRSLPPCSDSIFSGSSDELSVPFEDIVQMEWLSSFVEDSTGFHVDETTKGSPGKSLYYRWFGTSSPVSVMDRSSSGSADKTSTVAITMAPSHCGRARSKRPRPKTVNLRPITVSETSAESRLVIKNNPKAKKMKPSLAPTDSDSDPVRKCLHCEITKTPQWRAGPMGPKTLCNACGVRYKSGRLFPEYRPAASPSFVSSVHSNSHKKVLEMRHKGNGVIGV